MKYFLPGEQEPVALYTDLEAPNRAYSNEPAVRWHTEEIPVLPEDGVNFYRKCYEYFALGEPPFVPVEETLELMRVLDLCREQAPIVTVE